MGRQEDEDWRDNWRVDLASCTATHSNGLVVKFVKTEEGVWDGEAIAIPPTLTDPKLGARFAREAGDIYAEALRARH